MSHIRDPSFPSGMSPSAPGEWTIPWVWSSDLCHCQALLLFQCLCSCLCPRLHSQSSDSCSMGPFLLSTDASQAHVYIFTSLAAPQALRLTGQNGAQLSSPCSACSRWSVTAFPPLSNSLLFLTLSLISFDPLIRLLQVSTSVTLVQAGPTIYILRLIHV